MLDVPETRARSESETHPSIDAKTDVHYNVFATMNEDAMDIGYARVSTDDQDLSMQLDALRNAGIEDKWIFQESISGATTNRPQWLACKRALREGDRLVVFKLDRLGRSTKDLIDIMDYLDENGIQFRSLTEQIDTASPMGSLFFTLLAALAQFERDLVSERTKAGLAVARKMGRIGGRKPKMSKEDAERAVRLLNNDPEMKHEDVAAMFRVSRATLYRTWKRFGIEPPPPDRMDPDK